MSDQPLLVKKYGNRRLYDTDASRYITLDELAQLVRSGRDVKIIDAKTKADLTKMVLLQIISDQEKERDLLPISFLKKMIQLGDESMREALPRYLAFSLDAFIKAQKQFEQRYQNLAGSFFNPMVWLSQQGEVPGFDPAAMAGLVPQPDGSAEPPIEPQTEAPAAEAKPDEAPPATAEDEAPGEPPGSDAQIEALKAQVDQIQSMLSKLTGSQK